MKVISGGEVKELRALWREGEEIVFIDQRMLPHKLVFYRASSLKEATVAIREMIVRGAPAIGAAGALSLALSRRWGVDLQEAYRRLKETRPTAYDLFYALNRIRTVMKDDPEGGMVEAERYIEEVVERCRRIGEAGEELLEDGARVLTHCNAGALATVDWGTALAPIRMASRRGRRVFVWVDETRPWLQGSRLTSWELMGEGIEHRIIADNAAGHLMQRGEVDLVIVGADRITPGGDVANKIGTLEKAVLAREFGVPFYVAAPISTFDPSLKDWRDIPIEERREEEVLGFGGVKVAPEGARAKNPSFDVTPGKYITAYITELGVIGKDEIKRYLKEVG